MSTSHKRSDHPTKENSPKKLIVQHDSLPSNLQSPSTEVYVKIDKEAARIAAGKPKEEWKEFLVNSMVGRFGGYFQDYYDFVCELHEVEKLVNKEFSDVQPNFFEVLKDNDAILIEPLYQSQPCEKPTCRYNQKYTNARLYCKGGQQNIHHCTFCGNSDYAVDNNRCMCCDKRLCVDCAGHMIWLEDGLEECKHLEKLPEWLLFDIGVVLCPPCFLAHREVHCDDKTCTCQLKRYAVDKAWRKHQHKMVLEQRKWALRPKAPEGFV